MASHFALVFAVPITKCTFSGETTLLQRTVSFHCALSPSLLFGVPLQMSQDTSNRCVQGLSQTPCRCVIWITVLKMRDKRSCSLFYIPLIVFCDAPLVFLFVVTSCSLCMCDLYSIIPPSFLSPSRSSPNSPLTLSVLILC